MAIVGWRKDKKYCRNRSLRLCRSSRIFMYTKHIFSLSWYLTQLRFVQVLLLISSKLEQIILRLFDFSRRILILPFTQFKTRNRWKLFLFMFHFLSLSLSLPKKRRDIRCRISKIIRQLRLFWYICFLAYREIFIWTHNGSIEIVFYFLFSIANLS